MSAPLTMLDDFYCRFCHKKAPPEFLALVAADRDTR